MSEANFIEQVLKITGQKESFIAVLNFDNLNKFRLSTRNFKVKGALDEEHLAYFRGSVSELCAELLISDFISKSSHLGIVVVGEEQESSAQLAEEAYSAFSDHKEMFIMFALATDKFTWVNIKNGNYGLNLIEDDGDSSFELR